MLFSISERDAVRGSFLPTPRGLEALLMIQETLINFT